MSLSNPKLSNPAVKFIEFNGSTGTFHYYDKEKEEKVTLGMPFYFIVLDELSCIKGYSQRLGSGVYSNEVKYVKDEILTVRSFKGGFQIIGKYQDVKDAALREGGKYCKSVYAMLMGATPELVNFQFHGASFSGASDNSISGWINKKFNTEQCGVKVAETEPGQIGAVKFLSPVFENGWKLSTRPDVLAKATEMDKQLQSFLKSYMVSQIEKNISETEHLEPVNEMEGFMQENYPDLDEKLAESRKSGDDELPEGIQPLPF